MAREKPHGFSPKFMKLAAVELSKRGVRQSPEFLQHWSGPHHGGPRLLEHERNIQQIAVPHDTTGEEEKFVTMVDRFLFPASKTR